MLTAVIPHHFLSTSFLASTLAHSIILPTLLILLFPFAILTAVSLVFAAQIFWRILERHVFGIDSYRHLRSPRYTSRWWPLVGNSDHIGKKPPSDAYLDFLNEIGIPVFLYHTLKFEARLCISDPVAIAYLLSSAHSYDYPKAAFTRRYLTSILGKGLISAEGHDHRRARRVLQPAFNLSSVRNLTPTFFKYANLLSAKLGEGIDHTQGPSHTAFLPAQSGPSARVSRKGQPAVDCQAWLGMATMDIIGDAGFGHHFNALATIESDGLKEDAMASAFRAALGLRMDSTLFQKILFVLNRYPCFQWVDKIPTRRRIMAIRTYKLLEATSQEIITRKKAEVLKEMKMANLVDTDQQQAGGTKRFFEDLLPSGAPKDLIHLILRANMASDLPDHLRLHDHELTGQITTLILAGQETTSTQLTWTLWTLAQPQHRELRLKLRQEMRDLFAGRDELGYEELQSSRLLEKVTLESMRLLSAVPSTTRVALKDDIIPLSKAYPRKDGKGTFDHVRIQKGSEIFIFIQMLNRSPLIWGDDADEFKPDRWDDPPQTIRELKEANGVSGGVPAHGLWTFIAGPRGCIGKAFAMAEYKAILAVLMRDLQFDLIPDWEIVRRQGVVLRPRVKGQEKLGMQMPLYVSRAD